MATVGALPVVVHSAVVEEREHARQRVRVVDDATVVRATVQMQRYVRSHQRCGSFIR